MSGNIDSATIYPDGSYEYRSARPTANDLIKQAAGETMNRIHAQREEILEAFVAKYGCEPNEATQVFRHTQDGFRWWIEGIPGRVVYAEEPDKHE